MNLMQGDCLELMKNIPDGSVDMVLCDLPYGNTNAFWDKRIPFCHYGNSTAEYAKTMLQYCFFLNNHSVQSLSCQIRNISDMK